MGLGRDRGTAGPTPETTTADLKARFDDSEEAIVAFDASGQVVYVNPPAEEQLIAPGPHLARLDRPALGGRRFRPAESGRPRGRLFDAVFEHTPAALLVVDDDRRLLAVNRHARRTFGLTRRASTETSFDDLVAPPHGNSDGLWLRVLAEGRLSLRAMANTAAGRQAVVLRMHANVSPGRHLCMCVPPAAAPGQPSVPDEPRLSAREREILSGLAAGERSDEIAERLFLSAETVRTHVRNAMRKLEARSRVHAVIVAMQRGELGT